VTVPSDDVVGYFAAALGPGVRPMGARALDDEGRVLASGDLSAVSSLDEVPSGGGTTMDVDPALVPLPLGGTPVETPEMPEATDVLMSGDLPGGTWALAAGRADDQVILEWRQSDGSAFSIQHTPDRLAADPYWTAQSAEGRLVVWGTAPTEVGSVVVTLDDGTTVDTDTVRTVPDADVRAFAVGVPDGATITGIEGRGSDGSPVLRADDLAASLAHLSGPNPSDGVALGVVPAN
jgi:hypothetical protein